MSATLTEMRPPSSVLMGSNSNLGTGGLMRETSNKGKKRARSEYEAASAVLSTGTHTASTPEQQAKVSSARTRGVLLAFVDKALANARLGDKRDYNELLAQFQSATSSRPSSTQPAASSSTTSSNTASPSQLKSWLEALTHAVSQLDDRHRPLVDAIAALPWTTYPDPVRKSYIRFLCVLVAARPEHLKPVVEKAVLSLRWDTPQIYVGQNKDDSSQQDPEHSTNRRQVYDRVHLLLKALLDSVPTLAPTLLAALDRFAPPKRHKREAQVSYFQNVLRVLDYCPQLCEDILQTVIGRAVKMDVEIQVDVEEWEDEGGDLDREIFGYQVEDVLDQVPNEDDDASEADSDSDAGSDVASIDDLSDLEEAADDDDENDDAQNKAQDEDELDPKVVLKLQRTTAKLDAILKMLFSYLTQQDFQPKSSSSSSTRHSTPTGSRPTSPQRQSAQHSKDNLFEALLAIFDRTVLRAFKTRHTQFLLFWFASQHPDFADRFVGTLLHRVLHEADKPVLTRMASASYLASFLSRAKFIDSSTIKGAVGLLCEWLDDQLHLVSPSPTSSGFLPGPGRIRGSSSSLGPNQFAVFYSVTQALLYIFCYRWKDLLVEEEEDPDEDMLLNTLDGSTGRKWLPELHAIKKAITSSLNPLKVCTPAVVAQFVRIAAHVDFCWCYNIIESNRRAAKLGAEAATPLAMPMSSLDNPDAAPSDPQVLKTLQDAEVETHFPFEPYKLPLTKSYIEGIYREFEAPEGLEEEDLTTEDEDPDDSAASSLSISVESTGFGHRGLPIPSVTGKQRAARTTAGTSMDQDDAGFSKSFEAMSISPARR